jgi:hypothetical protein
MALLALVVALPILALTPTRGWAIKWAHGCPSTGPQAVDAGNRIFTSAPFVHPGHEIGFFLQEGFAPGSGFSLDPDGNTIEIVFRPLGGDRIALPAFTATAVSESALYFTFPDTRAVLGRLVTGPMDVNIRSAGGAWRATKPVALPPGNDVVGMLAQGNDVTAFGAVDDTRRLWIPLEFAGFGPGMPMPMCPMELTQKTAFAVKLTPSATDDDDVMPNASLTNMRKGKLYFGDFLMNGVDVYGEDSGTTLDVRQFRKGAVIICGLNDAMSLVMMIKLKESALGPKSKVVPVVKDGSPLPIPLANISAETDLQTVTTDTFGNQCAPRPDTNG